MDLTTRCPQCGTVFTATLEQLQLRKGYIRCISCAHIFDGYDAVVPGGEAPVATAATAATEATAAAAAEAMPSVLRQRQGKKEPAFTSGSEREPEPGRKPASVAARPAFSISATQQIGRDSSRHDPVFRMGDAGHPGTDPAVVRGRRPEPVLGRERDIVAAPEPSITELRHDAHHDGGARGPAAQIYVEPRSAASAVDHRRESDFLSPEVPRYRSIASLFWGVLIVAGLVLLLAQLAYVYRAQIAGEIPALRPLLTRACAQLGCEVPYARKIDLISIMSSSLRAATNRGAASSASGSGAASAGAAAAGTADTAAAPAASDSMTLQLTLRNTHDKPQEWPTLVLDLTDFSGTLVVRKNLPPSSYLTSEALQQPFAASSEITVGVPIVLNGLKVNGYQLGKFFP